MRLLLTGEVKRLVITHKDRLLRFGSELIFSKCEQLNVEVIIINHDINASPEQELLQDVLEINKRVFCPVVWIEKPSK